jgi:hypothetical protein
LPKRELPSPIRSLTPKLQFVESGVLDVKRFEDIVLRHGLAAAWRKFQQQFLEENK